MKTILSLDAGGIRGIIPLMILKEIEERTGLPSAELFDVVGGCSSGGIIAAAITSTDDGKTPKYKAEDVFELFKTLGDKIFDRTLLHTLKTGFGLWGTKYQSKNVAEVLDKVYNDNSIAENLTELVFTAYDLDTGRPFVMSSFDKNKSKIKLKDAVAGTTCVPSFFTPHEVKEADGSSHTLIDGGVFAVNPSACIYGEAIEYFKGPVMMISLGTGEVKKEIFPDRVKKWGIIQWLWNLRVLKILTDGSLDVMDDIIGSTLSKRPDAYYKRLQPIVSQKVFSSIDAVSEEDVNSIIEVGQKFIEENDEVIQEISLKLLECRRGKDVAE